MEKEAEAYRRLIDVGIALSAEKDINCLLERILVEAKTLVNADAGTLYLVGADGRELEFAIVLNDSLSIVQRGTSGEPFLPAIPLQNEQGEPNMINIATKCANSQQTIVIDDIYHASDIDSSGARRFDKLTGYQSRSFLSVPLKNFSDKTIGVLQLINAHNEAGEVIPFELTQVPLVEALTSQASVSLENRHLMDEQGQLRQKLEDEVDERTEELKNALSKLSEAHIILKELTTIDAVTGIRNRQYFDEVFDQEWRRAERQAYPITLMVIDIDHFKRVNDTFGHLAGDESLAAVARLIDGLFNRPSDVVARFGGEEFVVILPYVESRNAFEKAEQVRQRIEDLEINADGHQVKVTISIGWVSLVPMTSMTPRDMIAAADKQLYAAKAAGRNQVCPTLTQIVVSKA